MTALAPSPDILDPVPGARGAFTLDPSVVFLNHGSFGACPVAVQAAQAEVRQRIERQPVRFFMRELEPLLDSARAQLAAFVGADAEGLAFVPNATTGVNTVLRSLDLRPGDELLTTNHEYNACKNALEYVADRAGAKVVVAHVPFPIDGDDAIVRAVLSQVTARTRLALLDHVTSPTALVFPLQRLVQGLRERGVETMVDAAHAVGMVPLDLAALGAGYFTSNCHKWLFAPKGCAFLHVREDLRDGVVPLAISHGRNAERPARSRFRLLFDWTGTTDPSPYLAVPAALEFVASLLPGGAAALTQRNHALALWGRDRVCEALGVEPPAPDSMLGAMASVPLSGAPLGSTSPFELDPLQATLMERFHIEVPVCTWLDGAQGRRRALRVSAQAYNCAADYETLAASLRDIAG